MNAKLNIGDEVRIKHLTTLDGKPFIQRIYDLYTSARTGKVVKVVCNSCIYDVSEVTKKKRK